MYVSCEQAEIDIIDFVYEQEIGELTGLRFKTDAYYLDILKQDTTFNFVVHDTVDSFVVKRIKRYDDNTIDVYCYQKPFLLFKNYDVLNGEFSGSASEILDTILEGTIFERGTTPSQDVSLSLVYESRLNALKMLNEQCYYGVGEDGNYTTNIDDIVEIIDKTHIIYEDNDKISLSIPGAYYSNGKYKLYEVNLQNYVISFNDFEYNLSRPNKVIVIGDNVTGVAGEGVPVQVLTDKSIKDENIANKIAQIYLNSLNSFSFSIEVDSNLFFEKAIRLGVLASVEIDNTKFSNRIVKISVTDEKAKLVVGKGLLRTNEEFIMKFIENYQKNIKYG